MPGLRNATGLQFVPHFTTLQKAARRLLVSIPANRILDATLCITARRTRPRAIGGSGLVRPGVLPRQVATLCADVPAYRGFGRKRPTFASQSWGIVCNCDNHMILSTLLTRGPSPDVNQLRRTLMPAVHRASIKTLLADAGYESEANHVYCREHLAANFQSQQAVPPRLRCVCP